MSLTFYNLNRKFAILLQSLFLFFVPNSGFCEKGIILNCDDHFLETCFSSIAYLRDCLGCSLSIEIYHLGDALSENSKKQLQLLDVVFRDISIECNDQFKNFKEGYIKPLMLSLTQFEEVIFMDTDLFFFYDPERLFKHSQFEKTGAIFFRDLPELKFCGYEKQPKISAFGDVTPSYQYNHREKLFRSLISTPSESMPADWKQYWSDERPSFTHPRPSEHQKGCCIVLDKKRHKKGLEVLLSFYQEDKKIDMEILNGDKETYWIAFEIANECYYVNEEFPLRFFEIKDENKTEKGSIELIQLLDNKLLFAIKSLSKSKTNIFLLNSNSLNANTQASCDINKDLEHLFFYLQSLERSGKNVNELSRRLR